jgi:hypothetical protein
MIHYSTAHEMVFVLLATTSALALLSQHPAVSTVFFALAISFVAFEHSIQKYVKSL